MDEVFPYGEALALAVEEALPRWVVGCVEMIHRAWAGSVPEELLGQARRAGEQAKAEITPALRRLLHADIDAQSTTPLTILRRAVRYPTEVLESAGVPAVERDPDDEERFPDDRYGLTPVNFADFGPDVADRGLAWGAAKAFAHRRRHAPGPRS